MLAIAHILSGDLSATNPLHELGETQLQKLTTLYKILMLIR
ncbi:MAG: hypothetical protein PUP91_27100 [Rhizonema sp. PD37]|nr:hypothetical protein [Rhizonema sp. PD37]